jgi:glycosyltransferase involved in cell wall biosynthesis
MRIVYVSYLHPAVAPGGAQQVAYELFQASLQNGDDAYFIAALEQNHEAVYGKPGAPIVPVQGAEREYFYFPQNYDFLHLSVGDWRSVDFLRELIERLAPEVVHFHHYHRVGVESFRAARLAAPDAVICLTFHEMMAICMADGQMVKKNTRELCHSASSISCNKCFPELRPEFVTLRAARLKAALEECNLFIFPSEFIAGRYVEWGLAPEKCVVIPNGQFNLGAAFDRTQHSPAVNRFGFFGQLIDNKGVDLILEALLILGQEQRIPECGLVIEINGGNKHYASKGYLEKIMRQVDELKKIQGGRIEIRERGPYSREQLAERMRAIDWVLVPSTWWEIFGLVVSEAWMFGRPVVAAAIAGLKERVQPNINGFTFPARDSRALADLLVSLAGNDQQWLEVNRAIEQPWTEMEMLEAHQKVWREIQQKRDIEVVPQEVKPQLRKRRKMKMPQAPKNELERYAVPAV